MINKKSIVDALEAFISKAEHKLSSEEVGELKEIRDCIITSNNVEEIAKWTFELLKLIAMARELIDS